MRKFTPRQPIESAGAELRRITWYGSRRSGRKPRVVVRVIHRIVRRPTEGEVDCPIPWMSPRPMREEAHGVQGDEERASLVDRDSQAHASETRQRGRHQDRDDGERKAQVLEDHHASRAAQTDRER